VKTLKFDKNVYRLIALKKASYKFIDKISVNIRDEVNHHLVDVVFTKDLSDDAKEHLLNELLKEALDQDLRETIKKETEAYRNVILAHAFAKTSLIKNE
jgi:His-Xaa-Ser system protein HxsD